jgi:hypothetical protein
MRWGENGAAAHGTQALRASHARLPQMRTDFWPSGEDKWDPRVYGTQRRSVQSPSHSLRSCSGPAGPLLSFFELNCCRFGISIRRPEAHFALREAKA